MDSTGVSIEGICVSRELNKDIWEYVLRQLYMAEEETFFKTCHKAGGTMDECIASTLETISPNAAFYSFNVDGDLAGFFVRTEYEGKEILEGFHVMIGFRNKAVLKAFWDEIRKVFQKEIYVGIYKGNAPAFNHLVKNGFVLVGAIEHQGKIFNLLQNKLI